MAIATRIQRPCTRCGQPVEVTLHQSFVIEDEAALQTILDDRFHLLDCPQCGERRAFEADFLVVNKPRDLFIQVIGRDEDVAEMVQSMRSLLGTGQAHARIVPGRAELVEKIKLHSLGLDDVAIEVMKLLIRGQIGDHEGKISRHFDRMDGDDLLFRLRSPGEPPRGYKLSGQLYHELRSKLGTAAHAGELEVDERLARRLLGDGGAPAKAAGSAPAGAAVANKAVGAASGDAPTCALSVTHAGNDRRGRRFLSDGKILLLAALVEPTSAATPALLTTETVEGFLDRRPARWTPLIELARSKLHASAYRTSDDVALGELYVKLLLGLGKPLDLGTTERLGPVLLRDGAEIVGALMPLNLPPEQAAPPAPRAAAPDELRVPCPLCQGLIPHGDRFCEACGVGLSWKTDGAVLPSYPELLPGRVLVSESFETRPFPGRTTLTESRPGVMEGHPVPGGKLMTYQTPVTSSFVDYARSLRDACVRATFVPLDPGARIGLCARHSLVGKVQIYYLFDLMPLAGRAWCSRGVQTPEQATSTRLGAEAQVGPFPPGAAIELELRIAGPTLRAYVNRQLVVATHDAAFGSGGFGVRLGREHELGEPVRILCQGYEVREVLP